MLKAYYYPHSRIKTTTPYFDFFMDGLGDRILFVNRDQASGIGIVDIIRYLRKIDVAILNFPEDMIDKRFGNLQFIAFITFIVPFLKLSGRKLVWTMHNSRSHSESNRRVKDFLFSYLIRKSDIIIMHSRAGEEIVSLQNKKYLDKVFYFPHPVKNMGIQAAVASPEYDFIIWGAIAPYKGVDAFVKFIFEHPEYHKYRVLVVGKIKTPELEEEIRKYLTPNITLINRFVDDEELKDYILSARTVLFPYNHESVLASGALVYSINFRKAIIGPNTGAFADLSKDGLVFNFEEYSDIFDIDTSGFSTKLFDAYAEKVSWNEFLNALYERMLETGLRKRMH